ncbi:MAG: YybH family protein [Aureliella sp.]
MLRPAVTLCLVISALAVSAGLLSTGGRPDNLLAQQPKTNEANEDETGEELLRHLSDILMEQQSAWNEGDIEAFMSAYLPGEELTFSSRGKTQRGWAATKARYLTSYPDQDAMGQLKFSELEVEPLGTEHALMLGRWQLTKEEPAEGNFSLVWRKTGGKWLIIHDHSSSASE